MSSFGLLRDAIDQVMIITACNENTARYYLSISNNVPQAAINSFFVNGRKVIHKDWDKLGVKKDNDSKDLCVENMPKQIQQRNKNIPHVEPVNNTSKSYRVCGGHNDTDPTTEREKRKVQTDVRGEQEKKGTIEVRKRGTGETKARSR